MFYEGSPTGLQHYTTRLCIIKGKKAWGRVITSCKLFISGNESTPWWSFRSSRCTYTGLTCCNIMAPPENQHEDGSHILQPSQPLPSVVVFHKIIIQFTPFTPHFYCHWLQKLHDFQFLPPPLPPPFNVLCSQRKS